MHVDCKFGRMLVHCNVVALNHHNRTAAMPSRYTLLPTHNGSDQSKYNAITNVFLSRRYSRFFALALITLASFLLFIPRDAFQAVEYPPHPIPHDVLQSEEYPPYPIPYNIPPTEDMGPPLYERYTAYEQALPQHDGSLHFPEGSHAKFIFFANHAWGGGWGNTMQEMIMNANLAFSSGRALVILSWWDYQIVD